MVPWNEMEKVDTAKDAFCWSKRRPPASSQHYSLYTLLIPTLSVFNYSWKKNTRRWLDISATHGKVRFEYFQFLVICLSNLYASNVYENTPRVVPELAADFQLLQVMQEVRKQYRTMNFKMENLALYARIVARGDMKRPRRPPCAALRSFFLPVVMTPPPWSLTARLRGRLHPIHGKLLVLRGLWAWRPLP